ncbi:PepSY domain-containing protein [Thiococcus pfennigii]|uniref:PepSY domain-containing protein n=1 Tax=Thiococcus pfennigii TaxID=1057 RepID=UPI001906AF55|nr:hypothetical protein [Thiococcus pfennigii]MBK1701402.1 hypothetical protein [Thiococcus pfennigii]MBK1733202.1 hypothetical protein [Thiococcus pfennigii]
MTLPTMKTVLVLIATLALSAIGDPALARRDGGDGRPERRQDAGFSAGEAADAARRKTGGRVLSVKPDRDGYQVRMLTPEGEVRHVFVPGQRR